MITRRQFVQGNVAAVTAGLFASGAWSFAGSVKVPSLRDKILGCIAGSRMGSAFGAPVEGWSVDKIQAEYGVLDRFLPYAHYGKQWKRPPGTTEDGIERQKLMCLAIIEKQDRITVNDLAKKWVEENSDWFYEDGDEHDGDRRKLAIKLESDLTKKEGFSTLDPELYAELDKRLKQQGKEEDDDEDEEGAMLDDDDYEPVQMESPVAASQKGDDGSAKDRDPNSRRLRESDKQRMGMVNLDPNNPNDRKTWLNRNNL